ncbi:unnamed protein product [Clonostachys rosea f. rosea IK726]|jgi:nucleoside-diphosphate-sugar epimerase|uniref:NAD-dependent epimerase/dehydratase domain-containing protein n=2 Tax=Bionectria ochroleuca TaxID=29856 RepID=A0A0B7K818_BIOOC|nr:unnamed protein product [Clonostachys rosea f. rosea IK726]
MVVIPLGGLILVTGVNGYIAGVVAKTFLDHGYKVRGTVRSVSKYGWMPSYFGPNFSLAEVPDIHADNAFSEAVKGVDGIAHVAASLDMSPDPTIIDRTVRSTIGLLEAASKEPRVKRVVLTSSANACLDQIAGTPYKMTAESYNLGAIEKSKQAWNGEDTMRRGKVIYAASKALSEMKAFEWVRDNKPSFVFNSIIPNFNMGAPVAPDKLGFGSNTAILAALLRGQSSLLALFGSEWYVHVGDTALLHLGALTVEDVHNERLFAFAGRFSWGAVLEIIRRRFPEKGGSLPAVHEAAIDIGEVENHRSVEVLQKLAKDGFQSLEVAVVETLEAVIAAEGQADAPKSRAEETIEMLTKNAAQ